MFQSLHARMQQTHEQHTAESNTLRMQLEQMKATRGHAVSDPNQTAIIQQLRQENQQLTEAANQ